jgi:hypothetical protein
VSYPAEIDWSIAYDQTSLIAAIARVKAASGGQWQTIFLAPGVIPLTKVGTYGTGVEYAVLVDAVSRLKFEVMGGGCVQFTYNGSTAAANPCAAFMLNASSKVRFGPGISFTGTTTDDDYLTNNRPAIYLRGATYDIDVDRVDFKYCGAPISIISNVLQRGLNFTGGIVDDCPNALVPPSYSRIDGVQFKRTSVLASHSHFVYPFGRTEGLWIGGGTSFENCNEHSIKWKGNTGNLERKSKIVVDGCVAVNCHALLEAGSDAEVPHRQVVMTNCHATDCDMVLEIYGAEMVYVTDNTCLLTRRNTRSDCKGFQIKSSGIGSAGATSSTGGVFVARNQVVNEAHFVGELTVASQPAVGDTVLVGSKYYQFVAGDPAYTGVGSVGNPYQVSRDTPSSTAAGCTSRLADAIRGRTGYGYEIQMNPVLAKATDVQIEASDITPQVIVIDGFATYTLSVTVGSAITVSQAVTSYLSKLDTGILIAECPGPVDVSDNYVRDAEVSYSYTHCPDLRSYDNRVHGWVNPTGNTPYAYLSISCGGKDTPSEHRGNKFVATPATQDTPGRRMDVTDCFPLIGINPGVDLVSNTKLIESMHGLGGVATCGDGKARNLLWFGNPDVGGVSKWTTVQARPLIWYPGDTVVVDDGAGHSATFTYANTFDTTVTVLNGYPADYPGLKVTYVSGGAVFGTKAQLIAEINTALGAYLTATDFDGQASYGYVQIAMNTAGTAGNSATLVVNTASKSCGVVLQAAFVGGRSAADRTFVFSRAASPFRPLLFGGGVNSTGRALTGLACDQTDVVTGVGYLVQHSAASAGAKFAWGVANA